jgi:hypothetical protein
MLYDGLSEPRAETVGQSRRTIPPPFLNFIHRSLSLTSLLVRIIGSDSFALCGLTTLTVNAAVLP